MPGEDLYSLGQQAGIIPGEDDYSSGDSKYFNGISAPTVPSIGASAQGLEGRTGVMPGELSVPTAPLPDVSSGSSKGSHSSGQGGFYLDTYKTLTGLGKDVDTANAGADARAQSEKAELMAPINAASEEGRAANSEILKANQDLTRQTGIENLAMSQLNDKFAKDEAEANAHADAVSNQGKANYMAALMDFRASKVDPNQLWNSQSGGMQFGMLCAAFAHDFLGTKGIQTTAMDTLNKAIDRNINAQVEAIKTKGEVADGFKSLWYMQKSQSASDAEARLRVRGFLLDSAKQQVVAHLAQYQSALATAQSHAAQAKLDEETAKTTVGVYEKINENAIELRKQALSVIHDNKEFAIQWRKLQDEENKEKAAKANQVIVNPETGYAAWEFAPGLEPGEQKQVRDLMANKGEMNKSFNDLRTLMRESPSAPDIIAGTRIAGTDQQRYDSIVTRMAHSMVHANGERATDNDVKDYLKGMRPNTWLNQADADKVLAQTQKLMMRETDSYLQQKARDLPANDPRRQIQGARAPAFAGTAAETNTTLNPVNKTSSQNKLDNAIANIQEPSDKLEVSKEDLAQGKTKVGGNEWDRFNKEPLDTIDSGKDVRNEHKEFVESHFGQSFYKIGTETGLKEAKAKQYNLANNDPMRPKAFEEGMVRLKELAMSNTPEAGKALHQLAMYAKPYVGSTEGTGDQEDYKGAFALFMLHEISANQDKDVESPDKVRGE